MNIRTYFISTAERHQYTPFLMFKSTEVNLLISVWFDCRRRWQIRRYDWSDHLSIKLFANGQLHFQFLNYKQNQQKIWAYNWYINLLRNEAPCCFQFYMNLFKKKFYERLAQIHSASVSSMRRLWIALILAFAFRQTKKITKVWALKLLTYEHWQISEEELHWRLKALWKLSGLEIILWLSAFYSVNTLSLL